MPSLQIITRHELREFLDKLRSDGLKIGLVPTMGALHDGHLSLITEAKRLTDFVVTTIFVNPTQFAPGEDFEAYPRNLQSDIEKAESVGADLIFAPSIEEMYPKPHVTGVQVKEVSDGLCGAGRPGHFNGVTTIVAKLFHLVGPATAIFGQKDYQQLRVIETMVRDLFFPIKVVGCPTLRDTDGLALSSRNAYLSPEERRIAKGIPLALRAAESAYRQGERSADKLLAVAHAALSHDDIQVEYLELRGSNDLVSLSGLLSEPAVLALAVSIGKTRLIDNVILGVEAGRKA